MFSTLLGIFRPIVYYFPFIISMLSVMLSQRSRFNYYVHNNVPILLKIVVTIRAAVRAERLVVQFSCQTRTPLFRLD